MGRRLRGEREHQEHRHVADQRLDTRATFPGDQKITNAWNGVVTQSGDSVSIRNQSYNATIAAGAFTSLGFQGTWTSSDAVPTSFTVNGATC